VVVGSYLNVGGSMIILLRLLRLLRVLKLMRALPQLQVIVTALMSGGTSIMFISVLLFLFYYFAGIIAMILFGANDPRHFGTLHFTILTLFQCSTLDNWIDVMFINLYGCDVSGYDDYPEECTNPQGQFAITSIYFIVFTILGALVLLTLFIGVVTTGMDEAALEQKQAIEIEHKTLVVSQQRDISPHLVECYKEVFEMIDLNGGNTIEIGELKLGMKAAGRNITDAHLLTLWRKVDRNMSGDIDFSEFLTFMLNLRVEGDSRCSAKGSQFLRGPIELGESFYSMEGSPSPSVRSFKSASPSVRNTDGAAAKYDAPERPASPLLAPAPAEDDLAPAAKPLQPGPGSRPPSQAGSRPGSRGKSPSAAITPLASKPPSRPVSMPSGGALQEELELDDEYSSVMRPKPSARKPATASGKVAQDSTSWLQSEYGVAASHDEGEGDGILFMNDNEQVHDTKAPRGGFFETGPEVSPSRAMRSSKSHWHSDAAGEEGAVTPDRADRQRQYDERTTIHASLKLALQARHASFETEAETPSGKSTAGSDFRRGAQSTKSGKGGQSPGGRRVISKMVYI
jgi:hypothetical protein